MRKDFAKRKYTTKKTSPFRWAWWSSGCALIIFFGALSYSFFQYKQGKLNSPSLVSHFASIENWVSARTQHLQKKPVSELKVSKAKSVATAKHPYVQPVHFEFYTALPNMQVMMSDPVLAMKKNDDTVVATKKVAALKGAVVVSAEELENELSKHIKQHAYVIQLAVFRNAKSADKYHQDLTEAGFDANIVTLKNAEKETYRVQLGPYLSKVEARNMQKKLQKQGVEGLVVSMQ